MRKLHVFYLKILWCFLMQHVVSATNIMRLNDDHHRLAHCVKETSKRFFSSRDTLLFSSSIKRYYLKKGLFDEDGGFEYVTIPKDSYCRDNITSFEAFRFSKTLGNTTFSSDSNFGTTVSYNLASVETVILNYLHSLTNWPILVSPLPHTVSKISHSAFKNYILVVIFDRGNWLNLQRSLLRQIDFLLEINMLNIYARFLIVVTGSVQSSALAHMILSSLNGKLVMDAIVLVQDAKRHGTINVFTWYPYKLPSGKCGNLLDVVLLDTWVSDEDGGRFLHNADLHPSKHIGNIEYCCIRVLKHSNEPFVIMEGTGIRMSVGGLDVRLTKHIIEVMNMSLKNCIATSSQYEISMANNLNVRFMLNFADTQPYYYTIMYTFFVPLSKPFPRWTSMARVFSTHVWLSGFLSLLLSALFIRFIVIWKHVKESAKYNSTLYCLLNSLCVILGVGVDEVPQSNPLRVFFLSWIIYSFCINTIFQAYVFNYLLDPGYQHQIDSLQELIDLNFTLVFGAYEPFLRIIYGSNLTERSYYMETPENALRYSLNTPKSAILSSEDQLTYNLRKGCNLNGASPYHKFRENLLQVHLEMILMGNSLLQERVNVIMRRLVQSGIPEKVMRDITNPTGTKQGIKMDVSLEDEYSPMSLLHLQSPFILLLLGLGIGLLSFLIELVVYWVEKLIQNKNISVLKQQTINSAKK